MIIAMPDQHMMQCKISKTHQPRDMKTLSLFTLLDLSFLVIIHKTPTWTNADMFFGPGEAGLGRSLARWMNLLLA